MDNTSCKREGIQSIHASKEFSMPAALMKTTWEQGSKNEAEELELYFFTKWVGF